MGTGLRSALPPSKTALRLPQSLQPFPKFPQRNWLLALYLKIHWPDAFNQFITFLGLLIHARNLKRKGIILVLAVYLTSILWIFFNLYLGCAKDLSLLLKLRSAHQFSHGSSWNGLRATNMANGLACITRTVIHSPQLCFSSFLFDFSKLFLPSELLLKTSLWNSQFVLHDFVFGENELNFPSHLSDYLLKIPKVTLTGFSQLHQIWISAGELNPQRFGDLAGLNELGSQLCIILPEFLVESFLLFVCTVIIGREFILSNLSFGVESAAGRRVTVDKSGSFVGGLVRWISITRWRRSMARVCSSWKRFTVQLSQIRAVLTV